MMRFFSLHSFARLLPAAFFLLLLTTSSSSVVSVSAAKTKAAEDNSKVCPSSSKQLYVFIGPHRSAATSVEEFFYKYARGRQPNGEHGKTYHALGTIRWPLVYGEYTNSTYEAEPYRRFNSLITNNKKDINMHNEILDSIKRDWELPAGVKSIIFGGEEYDQIKPFIEGNGDGNKGNANNGGGSYDSINAISDVVKHLGINVKDCVTIIVNYRLSRFEHWISIYNEFNSRVSGQQDDQDEITTIRSYEEHMCSETSVDKKNRIRELGTTMNPMYLSTKFLNEGYNVKMIDMSGVSNFGTDISHTIGCNILQGKCEESGWVKGHVDETITNKVFDNSKNGQGAIERKLIDDAEKIFLYRDCAYEKELNDNPKFDMVLKSDVWNTCQNTDQTMSNVYQSLSGAYSGDVEEGNQLLFDALLSQVNCGNKKKKNKNGQLSMENVLSGGYIQNVQPHSSGKGKGKKNHHHFLWFLIIVFGVFLGFYVKKHGIDRTMLDGRRYMNDGRNYVTEMAAMTGQHGQSLSRGAQQQQRSSNFSNNGQSSFKDEEGSDSDNDDDDDDSDDSDNDNDGVITKKTGKNNNNRTSLSLGGGGGQPSSGGGSGIQAVTEGLFRRFSQPTDIINSSMVNTRTGFDVNAVIPSDPYCDEEEEEEEQIDII